MTSPARYSGADVFCPHCTKRVPGARLTFRAVAAREAGVIASETGVPVGILLDGQDRKTARARWALWARLKEHHRWPNARIARVCGGRDTTTVLLALRVLASEEGGTP